MIDVKRLTYDEIESNETSMKYLLRICLNENIPDVDDSDVQKYYENMKRFSKDGSAIIIGALDRDVLVGFQWAYQVNGVEGNRLHSSFDCVHPEYQGHHIGSKMMDKTVEIAEELQVSAIEAMCSASNENAIQYHLHNGFFIERYKVVRYLKQRES